MVCGLLEMPRAGHTAARRPVAFAFFAPKECSAIRFQVRPNKQKDYEPVGSFSGKRQGLAFHS